MWSYLPLKAVTCFIVLTFCNSPTTINAEFIVDTDGNEIRTGDTYYMAPVGWSSGGGVDYARTQSYHTRCPSFAVSQSPDFRCGTDYGAPVNIQPMYFDEENITDSSEVSIGFVGHPPRVPYNCDQPTMKWKMNNHGNNKVSADLGMFHFGGLGASDDEQGSAFKIVKHDPYGYKLTYCPKESKCGSLKPVFDRNYGFNRLVLAGDDEPFRFMFVKANGGRSPY